MCDLYSCFQQRSDVYSMPEEDGGAEQSQDLWDVWLRVWSEHWGAHCSYGVLVPATAGRMPSALHGLQSADVQSQPCHWHRGPGLEPLFLWLKPMGGDFEVSMHVCFCVRACTNTHWVVHRRKKQFAHIALCSAFFFEALWFFSPTSWSWGDIHLRFICLFLWSKICPIYIIYNIK